MTEYEMNADDRADKDSNDSIKSLRMWTFSILGCLVFWSLLITWWVS